VTSASGHAHADGRVYCHFHSSVTTPSQYKPRAPLRPPTIPPTRSRASVFDDVRAAAIRDVLQPYMFDDKAFRDAVGEELRGPVARPRIIEFGCGTGSFTLAALTTRHDAVYHGFERSEADVAIATVPASRTAPPSRLRSSSTAE